MEPRKNESKQEREARTEEPKRRFQIVKLEERIAPTCRLHFHKDGSYRYTGNCKGW